MVKTLFYHMKMVSVRLKKVKVHIALSMMTMALIQMKIGYMEIGFIQLVMVHFVMK